MDLKRISRKDCRKYLRLEYQLPLKIDQAFIDSIDVFGKPEYQFFSKISPKSKDLFRIRNYAFSFEIAGTMNDTFLTATFRMKDNEVVTYLEEEITNVLAILLTKQS